METGESEEAGPGGKRTTPSKTSRPVEHARRAGQQLRRSGVYSIFLCSTTATRLIPIRFR